MAFLCDEQPMEPEPLAEDESREDADGSGADGLVVGAAVEARLAALVEKQVAAALLRERQDAKATNEASKTSKAEEWVKARGTVYSLFIAGSDDSEQRGVPAFILFVQFVGVMGTWLAAENHFAYAAEEQLSCALVNGTAVPTCGAALELEPFLEPSLTSGASTWGSDLAGYEWVIIGYIEMFLCVWVFEDIQLAKHIMKIGDERDDPRIKVAGCLILILTASVVILNVFAAQRTFQSGGTALEAGLNAVIFLLFLDLDEKFNDVAETFWSDRESESDAGDDGAPAPEVK